MEHGVAIVRDDLASILRNSYDCAVDYMVFEGMDATGGLPLWVYRAVFERNIIYDESDPNKIAYKTIGNQTRECNFGDVLMCVDGKLAAISIELFDEIVSHRQERSELGRHQEKTD